LKQIEKGTTEMNKPWNCHVSGRFGSCGWNFATWDNALAYAKDQYGHAVRDATQFPSYQGILNDYRAVITDETGTKWMLYGKYFA
jgi:hypothetical protein